jgi:hypothetical protein
MKRKFVIFSLLLSLSGNPSLLAAQSSMPMIEMMRAMLVMMEMFRWMMGGGSNWSGGYPYGSAYPSLNPYLAGTSPFGFGGSAFPGYTGTSPASSNMGLWSYPAYMGNFPFNRLYPGVIPYGGIASDPTLGNWPNPAVNSFSNWYPDSFINPWSGTMPPAGISQWQSPYDYSRPQAPSTPVVVQPIIVQPSGSGQDASAGKPSVTLPPPSPLPGGRRPPGKDPNWSAEKLLRGQWLGINGEFLEFDGRHFQLIDGDIYLSGTYQVRNRILKAELDDSETPVYMQYRMQNEHLMFRSENNQLMLFRRVRR